MCTIAGYVGSKRAAPILIDMLRKEEGIDSGYYTGIATIHQGEIHYRKLVGDLEHLLRKTDAADLPGCVGFIHSRTPGKPWDSWAHPFTYDVDGEPQLAMVLNGTGGIFKKRNTPEKMQAIARELTREGFPMSSVVDDDQKGIGLVPGKRVHPTDVRVQYVARSITRGMSATEAIADMFYHYPVEAATLMMHRSQPDAIVWCRVNFPMHLSFCEHGAYLATVPLAFPEDAGEILLLPALSTGYVYADHYTCHPFPKAPATVAPITPKVWATAYERVENAIKNGTTRGFGPLFNMEFPEADCTQKNAVSWQVISALYREGKIRIDTEWLPGLVEGARVPKSHMIWVKDEERGEV